MKLALLGAGGKLGRRLLEDALARGHQVRVLVRSPEHLSLQHERLTVLQGDARDPDAVARLVHGSDAVINAIGGAGDIRAVALANVVQAMHRYGVRRLINLGGAGLLNLGPFKLYQLPVFPRAMMPVTMEHLKVWHALEESGLDWTLVCPPFMSEGPGSGGYRVRSGRPFFCAAKQVPLADVSRFILDEASTPRFIRQRVGIRSA